MSEYLASCFYPSPVGVLKIVATQSAVKEIRFTEEKGMVSMTEHALLKETVRQLEAYFNGSLRQFDLPLEPEGTSFQQKVWAALLTVPYGTTASYLDIAKAIGNPKAVRAVGMANGRNPIPIVIPCHRIIGSDGRLVGYSAGIERKIWLLKHEGLSVKP